MRMINADALREELLWCKEQSGAYDDHWKDVIERLDAQPTILPTSANWISVKDKLPRSIINKVLVWLEHEALNGYIGFGHYEKFMGEEMWYDLENNEQFAKRGYTVTHWMPLPEPPKEEE